MYIRYQPGEDEDRPNISAFLTGAASATVEVIDLLNDASLALTSNVPAQSAQDGDIFIFDLDNVTGTVGGATLEDVVYVDLAVVFTPNVGSKVSVHVVINGQQRRAFANNEVVLDATGSAGTAYPIGTTASPVSNFADAVTIANRYGFKKMFVNNGFYTLTAPVSGFNVRCATFNAFIATAGFDMTNTQWENAVLFGDAAGSGIGFDDCFVGITGGGASCQARRSLIATATSFANLNTIDCRTNFPVSVIDLGGVAGGTWNATRQTGFIDITNMGDAGSIVRLDHAGTQTVTVDATCTLGTVEIVGTCRVIDNSGPNCNVDTTGVRPSTPVVGMNASYNPDLDTVEINMSYETRGLVQGVANGSVSLFQKKDDVLIATNTGLTADAQGTMFTSFPAVGVTIEKGGTMIYAIGTLEIDGVVQTGWTGMTLVS